MGKEYLSHRLSNQQSLTSCRSLVLLLCCCLLRLSIVGETRADIPSAQSVNDAKRQITQLLLPFIVNHGQYPQHVAFQASVSGGAMAVTKDGKLIYSFPQKDKNAARQVMTFAEEFIGGRAAVVNGEEPLAARVQTFWGNDPTRWRRNLPAYHQVSLGDVYEGIQLRLKADHQTVEKLFVVQPGARPERIRLRLSGGKKLRVNAQGELEVEASSGVITFSKPVAYQEREGKRDEVDASYEVRGNTYGFRLGAYDRTQTLVIDPVLNVTFLGGSGDDSINALIVDNAGNVYVAGKTASLDFPGISGSFAPDQTFSGGSEAFVAKLNGALTQILSASFLGSGGDDEATALALDSAGNVYVAGVTSSLVFPGVGPNSADQFLTGTNEAFVVKLDAELSSIQAATFLGAQASDSASALAVDTAGNVYVVGQTTSIGFPGRINTFQFDANVGLAPEAFVAKLNADLSTVKSRFMGSFCDDGAQSVVVDGIGNVYIGGALEVCFFNGPFPHHSRLYFPGVTKLDSNLNMLQAKFLGTDLPISAGIGQASALALGPNGALYVAGETSSPNFPGIGPSSADRDRSGFPAEAFVAKLDANLNVSVSTFVGGPYDDTAPTLAVDRVGNVYVGGAIFGDASTPAPVLTGSFIARLDANLSAFQSVTSPGVFPTALTVDGQGGIYTVGTTERKDFPGIMSDSADRGAKKKEGIILHLSLNPIPKELRLPVGGQVVIELMKAESDFLLNALTLVSPTASVAQSGCKPKEVLLGVIGTPLLNVTRAEAGCRVVLDADPISSGIQEFSAGATLKLSIVEDLDFVGITHVQPMAFPGQIFRLAWRPAGSSQNTPPTVIAVVRIIHPLSSCIDCSDLDLDGDGLWDDWERFGLDVEGDGNIDLNLPGEGADPHTPDIFVELDYMDCMEPGSDCPVGSKHNHKPKDAAIKAVVDAFARGGLSRGPFRLHVDANEGIPHTEMIDFAGHDTTDFDALKARYFPPSSARRFVYHYGIFAHRQKGTYQGESGHADQPGNDFIVSLGGTHQKAPLADLDGDTLNDEHEGTVQEQAGTLMHELGHNLGLDHGGEEGDNFKPNYLSVMNHGFQLSGLTPTNGEALPPPLVGEVTYSNGLNRLALNENDLNERDGLCVGCSLLFLTKYVCPHNCPASSSTSLADLRPFPSSGPIDWNCDGDVTDTQVRGDINGDCEFRQLDDFDDWAGLRLPFQNVKNFTDGQHQAGGTSELNVVQLPTELYSQLDSFLRNGARNTNEGANPQLVVNANNRAIIGFTLPTLGGVATRAKLVLTLAARTKNWKVEGGSLRAYRLLTLLIEQGNGSSQKSEGTRGAGPGVTWQCANDLEIGNSREDCLVSWHGGEAAIGTMYSEVVVTSDVLPGTRMEWDVTAEVQAAQAEGADGIVWLLKKNERTTGQAVYYSHEGTQASGVDPQFAPRLQLWFD